jgi:hypothetical protein
MPLPPAMILRWQGLFFGLQRLIKELGDFRDVAKRTAY